MSLLNQMLNDLEQRRAEAGGAPTMHREIRPLPAVRQVSVLPRVALGSVVLGVLVAGVYWGLNRAADLPPAPTPSSAPAVTPAQVSDVALPVLTVALPPAAPVASQETEGRAAVPAPVAAAVPAAGAATLRLSEQLSMPLAAAPVAAGVAAVPPDASVGGVIEKRALEPNSREQAERLYRVAVNQLSQGREPEGVATLRAALREDPEHQAARQTLIKIHLDRRAYAAAESELDDGVQRLPKQISWVLLLARLRVDRGDVAGALGTLERHEGDAVRSAEYQAAMAAILQRLNRLPEAEMRFERATQIDPGSGRWWLGLGMAREAQGKSAEARDAFRSALSGAGLSTELRAYADARLR